MQSLKVQQKMIAENYRASNSYMLANKAHQDKLAQIQYKADRDDQGAAMREQVAHGNKLERMKVEQQKQIDLAEFNTELSLIPTLMEEDAKVRTSMLARMANSDKARDDVFKILAEALIDAESTPSGFGENAARQ